MESASSEIYNTKSRNNEDEGEADSKWKSEYELMFFFVDTVCLSVCLFFYLSVCLSIYLPTYHLSYLYITYLSVI